MIVKEFVHVVFYETNLVHQDQRPKIADEEETAQKKQNAVGLESAAGNQSAKKEIQSIESCKQQLN